jgi:acetyl esterase/lipase
VTRLDAERLAKAARLAGSDVRVDIVRGGIHGVQGLVNLEVPEAMAAWTSVSGFTDAVLGA